MLLHGAPPEQMDLLGRQVVDDSVRKPLRASSASCRIPRFDNGQAYVPGRDAVADVPWSMVTLQRQDAGHAEEQNLHSALKGRGTCTKCTASRRDLFEEFCFVEGRDEKTISCSRLPLPKQESKRADPGPS